MVKSIIIAIVSLAALSIQSFAQFKEGAFWLGASAGLTVYESSLAYSLTGEYAITDNIGAGVQVLYGGYSKEFGTSIPGVTLPTLDNTLFGGLLFGTYHFFPKEQLDPYGKIGLGYFNWSTSFSGTTSPGIAIDGEESGLAFLVQAGARYHFNESISANAAFGYPILANLGVDINFAGDGKSSSSNEDESKSKYAIFIGPYVAGKVSIKTAVAEGTKTGVVFNNPPDFGGSILIPFGVDSKLGFGLDVGLANYGYELKPEKAPTDTTTIVERYQFIGVFPHVNLGGFILGVNFGFAQSGSAITKIGDTTSVVGPFTVDTNRFNRVVTTFSPDNPRLPTYDPTQYMATMTEVRLGGSFTVLKSSLGKLNVTLLAGYSLSGLFNDERNYSGAYDAVEITENNQKFVTQVPNSSLNPNLVSLSIGLQYLFRLGF